MKYKVGDKVRVREWDEMEKEFGLDRNGDINCRKKFVSNMREYCGKVFTVRKAFSWCYSLEGCKTRLGIWWIFDYDMLEPVSDKKIVITSDGKTTLARLYDGKKVIQTAKAKCSPDDEFDFITGAKLAFDRLNSEDEHRGIKEAKYGAFYRVIGNSSPIHCFKIGEIVECIKVDDGSISIYRSETGKEQWLNNEDVELIEETKKPKFKVGDKIIGNEKANVYCITRKGWIGTVEDVYTSGRIKADGFDLDPDCFDLYVEPCYNGKAVCVEAKKYTAYTVGKIYEFKDGKVRLDNGNLHPVHSRVKNLDEWNNNPANLAKFIELKE